MRWMIAQFFEIRWWKRYLDHQEVDDYLTRKKAYWNQILSICPFQASHGDHILDAGCGPAGIFMNLQSYEVDAVDPLIGQYEQHLAHFSQKSYPNTRFHESPIEEFEVKKTYDIVFLSQCDQPRKGYSKSDPSIKSSYFRREMAGNFNRHASLGRYLKNCFAPFRQIFFTPINTM